MEAHLSDWLSLQLEEDYVSQRQIRVRRFADLSIETDSLARLVSLS